MIFSQLKISGTTQELHFSKEGHSSILFIFFYDFCKLCLQLRLLGNSIPRKTMPQIDHSFQGL